MIRPTLIVLTLCLLPLLAACHAQNIGRSLTPAQFAMVKRHEVSAAKVLDSLHDAASKADGKRYFSLFAPGAIFLGTDAGERWTLDEFKAYAAPIFARGKGWTYTPRERHVWVSMDGWATFDELLTNEKYGTCRGSGSMRYFDTIGWKIEQYDLSVPIPNDMLEGVAGQIREYQAKPKTPEAQSK